VPGVAQVMRHVAGVAQVVRHMMGAPAEMAQVQDQRQGGEQEAKEEETQV